MDLGVDEAYALAVARPLQASYFDHPPMVFWLVAGMERVTGSAAAALLRLPFLLCFAVTTYKIATLGRTLFGPRAGLLGAVVLNLTGLLGYAHGSWIVPDGPLLCALAVAADALATLIFVPASDRRHDGWYWLIVGVAAGAAGLSKYHAIFLPLGVLGFLATTQRLALLRSPWPWLAGAIAAAMCVPVVTWNMAHDWASFRFQLGRADSRSTGWSIEPFLQNVAGQMGYILPWVWGPLLWAGGHAVRRGLRDERRWFLLCLAAGPLVVFTLVTLGGRRALPHWQGPGYLFLAPLLGAALDERLRHGATWPHRWMRQSAIAVCALATLLVTQTRFGWITRLAPSLFRRGDPSHEALAWTPLRTAVLGTPRLADARVSFIATTHWIEAARVGSVLRGSPAGDAPPLIVLSDDTRNFRFQHDPSAFAGRSGVLVRRAREQSPDSMLRRHFTALTPIARVPVRRAGIWQFDLEVYRAEGLRWP
ncbi:ArnT family glycosyltransferase [Gemmatimonas sp.]|jgi:4-amino-4-deoxy-L-arabinose transferase-like glycosyltransferase|uniref:ArnT family glycosyltransferase n=1 Tax=Gemmatimonas sp. TaxID=1962908 RepID=UPI0037C0E56A